MTREDYELLASWLGRELHSLNTAVGLGLVLQAANAEFNLDLFLKSYRRVVNATLAEERGGAHAAHS